MNHGYDDERGDYKTVTHDHLAYRYEVVDLLGRGSFGQVLKCLDHKTKMLKAVKVIRNKKRFHHQALIELKILEHLRHKDADDSHNVIHIEEYFYFRNHLCISFELLSINLYELIKNGNFQGLSMSLVRRFAIQMLVSLNFLKKLRIVHCGKGSRGTARPGRPSPAAAVASACAPHPKLPGEVLFHGSRPHVSHSRGLQT